MSPARTKSARTLSSPRAISSGVRPQYGYGSMNGMATYRPAFKPEIDSGDVRPAARRNLATRPHEQHFDFDYMGNTLTTTDDLSARYDRSLGPVTNGDGTGWGPNQLTAAQGVSARYDESGNLVELKVERPGNCPSGMGSRCAQWYAYEWDEIGQPSARMGGHGVGDGALD